MATPDIKNPSVSLISVLDERKRQDKKWGEQNHDPYTWLAVLQEEVGEYAKEALEMHFGKKDNLVELYKECVHVAAVALAMVECIDRHKWRFPQR